MAKARIEPVWIDAGVALALHDRQLAEHGGPGGIRDPAALESALARPVDRWAYGEDDRYSLAASNALGLARTHPLADGNKRMAWIAARLFLRLNGCMLSFSERDAIDVVIALAAGELTEAALADWFRAHGLG